MVELGKGCPLLLHSNIERLFPNSVRGLDLSVYSAFILLSFVERRLTKGRSPVLGVLSGIYKQNSEVRTAVSFGCIILISWLKLIVDLKALCDAVGVREF